MHSQNQHLSQFGREPLEGGLDIEFSTKFAEASVGGGRHFLAVAIGKKTEPDLPPNEIQPHMTRQRVEERGELGRGLVFGSIIP